MKRLLLVILLFILSLNTFAQTAAPGNFTAQQVNLENKVKLDWAAPSGTFTGYELVYTNLTTSVTDTLKLTKISTYTLSGLAVENTYSFKLRTYENAKFSPYTSTIQVPIVRLNPPTLNLVASKTSTESFEVTVIDNNKFKTSFTAELSSPAGSTLININKNTNNLNEVFSGLKPNTAYKLRVKTNYNSLSGAWSNYLDIQTQALSVPNNPSGFSANQAALQNSISLSWTAPSTNLTGYKLYFKKGNAAENSVNIGKVNSYTLNNLDYESTYTLRMRAFSAAQNDTVWASGFTPSLTVNLTQLKAPSLVAEQVALDSFTVRFNDTNAFETGFNIEFEAPSGVTTRNIAGAKSNFSETFKGLKPNTLYKVRVRANRNNENGPWSNWLSVRTSAHTPPALPTNFVAEQVNLENIIKLSWTAAPEPINGYIIYYKNDAQNSEDSVKIGKLTTYSLANLALENIYSIRIKTYKTINSETIWSAGFTPTQNVELAKLDAPTITADTSKITYKSFELTITDKNKYETGFEIEINNNGNISKLVLNQKGSTIKHILENLSPKTLYSVRVRPLKGTTAGTWSSWLEVLTKIDVPAEAILTLNSPCPKGVSFSWVYQVRENEIASQTLYKSQNPNAFSNGVKLDMNIKNHNDIEIQDGQTYYYKIVTKNISGETHSKILTVEVPPFVAPSVPLNVQSLQSNKSVSHLFFTWEHGAQDLACETNILKNTEIAIKINNGPLTVINKVSEHITFIKIEDLQPRDKVEAFFRTYSTKDKISNWVSVLDSTLGAPYIPGNVLGILQSSPVGNPELHISWKDNSFDEDYFRIEKSLDGKNFFPFTFTLANTTKVIDTDIEEGKNYYYRVQAGSWVDDSPFTPVAGPFFIHYTQVPNAPYGLQLTEQNKKVILKWVDDSIREEAFVIERSDENAEKFEVIFTTDADVTYFEDENVLPGKIYSYRIKATNIKGSSAYSKIEKITMKKEGLNVNIFPNPISDILNLQLTGAEDNSAIKIQVYNQNNNLVIDTNKDLDTTQKTNLRVSQLSPGLYTLIISNSKKETIAKKIIKI